MIKRRGGADRCRGRPRRQDPQPPAAHPAREAQCTDLISALLLLSRNERRQGDYRCRQGRGTMLGCASRCSSAANRWNCAWKAASNNACTRRRPPVNVALGNLVGNAVSTAFGRSGGAAAAGRGGGGGHGPGSTQRTRRGCSSAATAAAHAEHSQSGGIGLSIVRRQYCRLCGWSVQVRPGDARAGGSAAAVLAGGMGRGARRQRCFDGIMPGRSRVPRMNTPPPAGAIASRRPRTQRGTAQEIHSRARLRSRLHRPHGSSSGTRRAAATMRRWTWTTGAGSSRGGAALAEIFEASRPIARRRLHLDLPSPGQRRACNFRRATGVAAVAGGRVRRIAAPADRRSTTTGCRRAGNHLLPPVR